MLIRVCDLCEKVNPTTYSIPAGPTDEWTPSDLDLCDSCTVNLVRRLYTAEEIRNRLRGTNHIVRNVLTMWILEAREDPDLVLKFWSAVKDTRPAFNRRA